MLIAMQLLEVELRLLDFTRIVVIERKRCFLRIVFFKRRFWIDVKSFLIEIASIGLRIMKLHFFLINMV